MRSRDNVLEGGQVPPRAGREPIASSPSLAVTHEYGDGATHGRVSRR
jgi:hypothetical protein